MECISDQKILESIEGQASKLEMSVYRDHLLVCPHCRQVADRYLALNRQLVKPVLYEPPLTIVRKVMATLYPDFPVYSSLLALIASSFVFLVTWIYIYFDFAHNSLVKALQLTSDSASGWLTQAIKFISTVFSLVYASFKAIHAFIAIVFKTDVSVEAITAFMLTMSLLFFFILSRFFARRLKGNRK